MDESTLNVLPREVLELIIELLPITHLIKLSSVCKYLNIMCKNTYGYIAKYEDIITTGFECKCGMRQYMLTLIPDPDNTTYMKDKLELYNKEWPTIPKSLLLTNNYIGNKALVKLITTLYNLYYIYIDEFMSEDFSNLLSVHLPTTAKILIFNNKLFKRDKISFTSDCFRYVTRMTFIYYLFDEHHLNFANLSFLCLIECAFILTDELKEQFSNIESLALHWCHELYSQTTNMNYLKNNINLMLVGCETINIDFKHFSTCVKLESLKIEFNNPEYDRFPYENLSELRKGNLKCLKLSENTNKIRMFENLNGLEDIKYLHLNNFDILAINNKMNNHMLSLSNSNITNDNLKQLIKVKRLCITHNRLIDDIRILGSLESEVEILDISYNPNIKYIDSLTNLLELNVLGCYIMIPMLNHMHKFNNTRVFIENCYCENCRFNYKYTDLEKYALMQPITIKCLYPDIYNYFHL